MKPIGTLIPDSPFFLAPMEAVNCASFRVLCKQRGAGLVYTDMIDADIFMEFVRSHSEQEAIDKFINPQPDESPLVVQLGGPNAKNLCDAIQIIQPIAAMIDLNVGCPLGYMLGKKGGVYLMKHPDQLYKIVTAMRQTCTIPFSVKLRAGWDDKSKNAVEVALELERLGVDAVTIHGRTRTQRYRERADWPLVRNVADALSIPVILSGDVTNAYMARMGFAHTHCDYIMIARGAQMNPSVITALRLFETAITKPLTRYEKSSAAITDYEDFVRLYTEREKRFSLSELRDHALWTVVEATNASFLKESLLGAQSVDELLAVVRKAKF